MHYKNGREAKNGDKVLCLHSYGAPVVGILYDAVAGNNNCNGKIAPTNPNDPMPNLAECLHIDDVKERLDAGAANPGELQRVYAELREYQAQYGALGIPRSATNVGGGDTGDVGATAAPSVSAIK